LALGQRVLKTHIEAKVETWCEHVTKRRGRERERERERESKRKM